MLRLARAARAALGPCRNRQDDKDHKKKPQASTGIISPVRAVGPQGQGADEKKYKKNNQDQLHGNALLQMHALNVGSQEGVPVSA